MPLNFRFHKIKNIDSVKMYQLFLYIERKAQSVKKSFLLLA